MLTVMPIKRPSEHARIDETLFRHSVGAGASDHLNRAA